MMTMEVAVTMTTKNHRQAVAVVEMAVVEEAEVVPLRINLPQFLLLLVLLVRSYLLQLLMLWAEFLRLRN